jgi:TonB family protein
MRFQIRLLLAICTVTIAPAMAEAQTPRRAPNEPELLKEVRPEYTPEGRAAGIEGVVVLSAHVLTDGTIGEVQVVRSLDENTYGLDQEAVKAMKQWVFKPPMKDGEPVSTVVHVGIVFSLKENTAPTKP